MRRVLDLKLVRDRQPMFALTWTVHHVIDKDSPLFGIDVSATGTLIAVVATLMGHDGTYGQTVYSRKLYQPGDIHFDHTYVDVMSQLPDGRLVIETSTQVPWSVRNWTAKILGVDSSSVRVIVPPVGGGFGMKFEVGLEPYAAALARATGQPVRLVNSRMEEMATALCRENAEIRLRIEL